MAQKAMMHPHFIFNVINSIQHFINAGDKQAANVYLVDFAKLIRMSAAFSEKSLVNLAEEMAYLNLYLSFEKLRFGDNLRYEIIVNPTIELEEKSIAVMMIQPFLENAIWHGILPMNANGHVTLKMDLESDTLLKVSIADNGLGIKEIFISNNLLDPIHENQEHCIAIQRLKHLANHSSEKLYMRYKHMHPEKANKGTIAEFLLPTV